MELQLDYWLITGKASEAPVVSKSGKGDTTKSTLKTTFRSLLSKTSPCWGATNTALSHELLHKGEEAEK